MPKIFHLALRPDWEVASADGGPYEISTRGRTLRDVGFIHACRTHDQVDRVRRSFYADLDALEDLVLLVIDTDRLGAPVRDEPADGDVFPHIYGPVPLDAVIQVRPLGETR
ncbi:MAG TPA: DUF952 domain-containing protein [Streptosporangiaceae bacterium]|nr:DUF952 domain-containing protein [Streptosporangiaceae bacterium]